MVFPFIPLLSRSFIAHNNIYRLITSLIKVISYITLKYPVVKTMKQNFQNYNHVHNTLRFFDVWANFRELIWKLEVCRKYFVNGRFMPLFVWPLLLYWYSTWGFKQLKLWVYRLFNVLWVNTISQRRKTKLFLNLLVDTWLLARKYYIFTIQMQYVSLIWSLYQHFY